jgi:hypothetical protein
MNLLCPNCQKMLTVPEHAAGQQMGCPLCNGKFTVPNAPPPVVSEPPPPPPAPPSPQPPTETYSLAPEPAFSAPPKPAPPPEPAFTSTPAPKPASTSTASTPTPSTPGGYTTTVHLTPKEHVLQWVPVACVVVIFFLTFFPWVRVAPGDVPAVWQNAWQAAFGGYSTDPDLQKHYTVTKSTAERVGNEPGIDPLCLFYLLFFLATLVFSALIVAQPYFKLPWPKPQQTLDQLMPYRRTILAGLNAVLLLFLGLQLLLNFSLESRFKAWVEEQPTVKATGELKTEQKKERDVQRGMYLSWLQRSVWLWLVFWLHVLATAAAGLVYWMERRGASKPPPYLELRW